jgi:hypothetical protein
MSRGDGDGADQALDLLRDQLETTIRDLRRAADRVRELQHMRAAGESWRDIVTIEDRPLVVEYVTSALTDLGAVGGLFRRQQALALRREGVSINRIGQLFGVSRQRASVLVKSHPESDPDGVPALTDRDVTSARSSGIAAEHPHGA